MIYIYIALAVIAVRPAWIASGRFADWFTAERGTGTGKNGWV